MDRTRRAVALIAMLMVACGNEPQTTPPPPAEPVTVEETLSPEPTPEAEVASAEATPSGATPTDARSAGPTIDHPGTCEVVSTETIEGFHRAMHPALGATPEGVVLAYAVDDEHVTFRRFDRRGSPSGEPSLVEMRNGARMLGRALWLGDRWLLLSRGACGPQRCTWARSVGPDGSGIGETQVLGDYAASLEDVGVSGRDIYIGVDHRTRHTAFARYRVEDDGMLTREALVSEADTSSLNRGEVEAIAVDRERVAMIVTSFDYDDQFAEHRLVVRPGEGLINLRGLRALELRQLAFVDDGLRLVYARPDAAPRIMRFTLSGERIGESTAIEGDLAHPNPVRLVASRSEALRVDGAGRVVGEPIGLGESFGRPRPPARAEGDIAGGIAVRWDRIGQRTEMRVSIVSCGSESDE